MYRIILMINVEMHNIRKYRSNQMQNNAKVIPKCII